MADNGAKKSAPPVADAKDAKSGGAVPKPPPRMTPEERKRFEDVVSHGLSHEDPVGLMRERENRTFGISKKVTEDFAKLGMDVSPGKMLDGGDAAKAPQAKGPSGNKSK